MKDKRDFTQRAADTDDERGAQDDFFFHRQFYSDAAHELRTPLAVIMAQCESAQKHQMNIEEYRHAIEVIDFQANKINHILGQLLKLNRLTVGSDLLRKERISLEDMIYRVCENEKKIWDVNLEFCISVQVTEIFADGNLMSILLQNLVNNAVKYSIMDEEQTKTIVIEISAYKRERDVYIKVKDYGCGISSGNLRKIFLPFYRVKKEGGGAGYGIGLSIAERIARIHDGMLYAESVQGRGSIFTVTLTDSDQTCQS